MYWLTSREASADEAIGWYALQSIVRIPRAVEGRARKSHQGAGAPTRAVFETQRAAVQVDDAVREGETEADAVRPRRRERQEEAFADRWRDPHAAVADGDLVALGAPTGRQLDATAGAPGPLLGFDGVVQEVAQRSFEQLRVALQHGGRRPRFLVVQLHGGERRVGGGTLGDPTQVDRFEPGRSGAGEGEEIGDDALQLCRLAPQLGDEFAALLGLTAALEQRDVAIDRRQAVAQLVGDAGRELAEMRQALGELTLARLTVFGGQVGEEDQDPERLAVAALQGRRGEPEGTLGAGGADGDLAALEALLLFERSGEQARERGLVREEPRRSPPGGAAAAPRAARGRRR